MLGAKLRALDAGHQQNPEVATPGRPAIGEDIEEAVANHLPFAVTIGAISTVHNIFMDFS